MAQLVPPLELSGEPDDKQPTATSAAAATPASASDMRIPPVPPEKLRLSPKRTTAAGKANGGVSNDLPDPPPPSQSLS